MRVAGEVWRYIPEGAHPLHVGYILRAEGRWNRSGVYGCLQSSFSEEGAKAEYRKYLQKANIQVRSARPMEWVAIKVNIEPVMDLTTRKKSLIAPDAPFLTGDKPGDLENCRALADTIREQGFAGIIAPSAAPGGATNLIIYIDGPAGKIILDVGGTRKLLKV